MPRGLTKRQAPGLFFGAGGGSLCPKNLTIFRKPGNYPTNLTICGEPQNPWVRLLIHNLSYPQTAWRGATNFIGTKL